MTERVAHGLVPGVVPAVADEDPFAVPDRAQLPGEAEIGRRILQPQRDGLGEAAGGRHPPPQHLGDGTAAGLPGQPALEDGLRVRLDLPQRHHAPVRQDDDHPVADRRHRTEHGELVGGQVEVGAVEALGLLGGREPEDDDDRAGRTGGGHRLVGQGGVVRTRVAGTLVESVAGGVPHGDALRRQLAQRRQRGLHPGGVDLRAAGALVARRLGERADDRDLGGRVLRPERQRLRLVLQQHQRLPGGLQRDVVLRLVVDGGTRLGGGAGGQREHPGGAGVEVGLVHLAGAGRLEQADVSDPVVRRHLQVEAGPQRPGPVDDRAPVGDDETVEAPLLAEDLGEQPVVLRGPGAVDLVVGAHHRPRVRAGDDVLEGGQVDLAQGALVDLGADPQAFGLLVVHREVLQRGADPFGLQPADPGGAERPGEQRVLGEVLEVAPAQRRALDVHPGPEDDSHPLRPRLPAERLADPLGQTRVPAGGQGRGRGEAGRRDAVADPEVVRALVLRAQPVRPVGEHHRGHPEPGHRGRVPEVGAHAQRHLLLQRQVGGLRGSAVLVRGLVHDRSTFSIGRPLASSSTSLSR
ncbi:hypothetical protein GCM10027055_12000 [Janibacter alkaliphilus]|uniref:Uncharacterized protein n=1 Tax=Janibacter alkaliphilus TaxID=1069963 RepID=A0A852X5V3_9MICO|nr:hypothetical protein [Janibacter alkaliphilus]